MTTTGVPAPAEIAPAAAAGPRVPAPLLVLGGVVSVQLGAAIAKQLFPRIGPEGTVMLRLVAGALLLWLVVRPTRRVLAGLDLRLTLAFGAVLAAMNLSFYLAIARIRSVSPSRWSSWGRSGWRSQALAGCVSSGRRRSPRSPSCC